MSTINHTNQPEKNGLHSRNPHRFRYNFQELILSCSELERFVFVNKFGNESIDFADPSAVKALNKALLCCFYDVKVWDIPSNYLCPSIPGRADYIHYLADLLALCNGGEIPKGDKIVGLDVGVGANCVYPIIGVKEYEWRFVGSDIDKVAIESSQKIVKNNPILTGKVEIRLQPSPDNIFKAIAGANERFDFTICNPPFHSSAEEAAQVSQRKQRNLGYKGNKPALNFGGQSNELWCEGGEESFLYRMVKESVGFATQCFWFTSLVSKSSSLPFVYRNLKASNALEVRTVDMAQGQKISRFVAWTFLNEKERREWREKRWIVL